MLKKYTQTDRYGNMMSQEMDGKFLKKKILKDRHGNKMSFEFNIPESNVPPVSTIPQYSAKGGDANNHPGGPKGTDTVPAWLTPGEFVVNKEATDIFGDVIEKMNNVGRKIQKQNGSAPDKMTDVPYAAEGMFIPRKFMPPHLKDRPSSVKGLESDPMFQDQLAKMLNSSLTSEGDKFSKEELYKVISGESDFKVGAKNETGSASGLFQFTTTATEDLVDRGLVPPELLNEDNNLTPEDVRRMTPTQQLKLYEAYLKGAGYKGDVPLGAMQGSPGLYSTLRKAKNPNHIIFNKNNPDPKIKRIFERNQGWIGKDGNITLASIQDHYDKRGSRVNKELAASKVPGVTVETADQIPPSNIVPVSNTSGAQNIAGVPPVNLPIDTALNVKSAPTDNFSVNIPNYSGSVPVESDMEITNPNQGVVTNPRIGYESFDDLLRTKPMYALDMDADGRPDVSTIGMEEQLYGSPKIVMPPIEGTNVETKTLSEKIADAMPTIPRGKIVPRANEEDYQNFSGDIDAYIPQPPPVYQDAVMRAAESQEKPEVDTTKIGGKSMRELIDNSFGTDIGKDRYAPKIKENLEKKGLNLDAPVMFPPKDGKSTVPNVETETFRGTINEGKHDKNSSQPQITEKNVDEKIGKLAEVASNTKANEKLENTNKNTVEETGGKASQEEKNKATNFLESIFGSLFNKNELKRMAVMYLGSRLMGYDHGGSLNFAVKNYVARVDSLEASRIKFSQSAQAKNYTPESVAEYVRTGDYSKLIPLGNQVYRQGNYKTWYNKVTGNKMVVEEVHVGTGDKKEVRYMGRDGKFYNQFDFDETGIYSKNSKDRLEIVSKFNKTFADIIKEEKVKMEAELGDSLANIDGLNTIEAAGEIINHMLDKRADITQIQSIIPMAYRAAINAELNSGNKPRKITSLVPILNELMYETKTGQHNLFRTQPDKKHEKDWDGVAGKRDHMDIVKFNKALDTAAYIVMDQYPQMNKNEAAALYIDDLAEMWNGVRMEGDKLDPENLTKMDRKDYWKLAYLNNTSGFYEFLKERLDAEINDVLGKN